MKKCTQCGKPAIHKIEGGHLLCLDCYYKFESIEQQKLATLLAQKNFYIEQLEATVGLPGMFPKHQIPQPAPIINRNINISNSTVGAVNTGYVESLKVNIPQIAEQGQEELAKLLFTFTENILHDIKLNNETKNEVLEQIEFLSNQLTGKEPLRKSVVKSVLNSVPVLIQTSDSLLSIWDKISEKISALL
jgi:hypothetical protein